MPIAKPKFDDVPEWPERPTAAPMGHNKPPLEELIPQEFRAELLRDRPDFLTRLEQLIDAANRARAEDDETLAKCGDLVKAYRALLNHVDVTHRTVKQPHLDAGRLVDAEKRALSARIEEAKAKVERMQADYLREQQRKEREERARIEAERRRLEELARENEIDLDTVAPPPPPVSRPEPVHSDEGTTISRLTEWRIEIESWPKAIKHVLDDARVREVAGAALLRIVKQTKGAKALAGVKIIEDVKAGNR